jgi:short-subunit dehydrogenase
MTTGDTWALITGASSGIGRALAYEFAAEGYHLFLTARNRQALEEAASNCAAHFNVQTRIHLADLTRHDDIDSLIAAVSAEPLPFGALVNNAGFGVKGTFLGTDLDQELGMVSVQVDAMLKLTKAVAPGMVARKHGHILNVASVYSFAPVPYQTVYGACKSFLWSFSAALRAELSGTGVTVTVLCPGVTQTEFRARAGIPERNKSAGVTAEHVARIAVKHTLRGDLIVVPGLPNKLFVFMARHLPISVFHHFITLVNNLRGVNKTVKSDE